MILTSTKKCKYHTVIVDISITSKISLSSLSQYPSSIPIDLLSVTIAFTSPECHTNGIKQYLGFWAWLTSLSIMHLRFIYAVAYVGSSFSFTLFYFAEYHSIVWIYDIIFTNWWTFGLFSVWLSWVKLLEKFVTRIFRERVFICIG